VAAFIVNAEICVRVNCMKNGIPRYRNSVLQRKLMLQLTRNTDITIPEKGIYEIERFQRFLAAENIIIIVYNFSNFGRSENLLYDGRALLASLGREHSYCLHVMYYERSRHYNPILNLKAAAGARGDIACHTTWLSKQ